MFNPVGAIIQAVITIYNMIQFFIERAKQIAAFVNSVFNSIAEIAGGNLKKAVTAVEDSLAKALPVAISFLANLVGIGGIAAKIKEIIQKIRDPIDKAVGKVVGVIVGKAKALIGKISGADKPKEEAPKNEAEHDAQVNAGLAALDKEQQKEDEDHSGALTQDEAIEVAQKVKAAYPVFKSITPVEKGDRWEFEYVASHGVYEGFRVKKDQATLAKIRKLFGDEIADKVDEFFGAYKEIGGHHVHAKAGFKNHFKYDSEKGFSISQEFMEKMHWRHQVMTAMQWKLFNELAQSGKANSLEEHTRIAIESLTAAGATKEQAQFLVNQSLLNLTEQGVSSTTHIPWN